MDCGVGILTVPYPDDIGQLVVVLKPVVDHVPQLLEHLVRGAVPALESPPEPRIACLVQRTEQDSHTLAFHALDLCRNKIYVVDHGFVFLGAGSYGVYLAEVGYLAGVERIAAGRIINILRDIPVPCECAQSA